MINISKASLFVDIENGFKRDQIIEKYSTDTVKLTNGDVTKILQQTGSRIKKYHRPKFQIIDNVPLPMNTNEAVSIKETAEKGSYFDAAAQ